VRQDGKVIFNLTASFQAPEKGLSHQIPMTGILPPEECWDFADFIAVDPKISDRRIEHMARMHPFEVRAVRPPPSEKATMQYEWFRISAPIGDDPLIHRALLAYASDMGLLSTTLLPHAMTWDTPGLFSTSLDHAMWFHDDIRVDEWFVYVMDSDWSGGGRGINRGRIYRRDGTLIASAVQEGLIRYDPSAE
jgi:acyl-CoA thioesterase-2